LPALQCTRRRQDTADAGRLRGRDRQERLAPLSSRTANGLSSDPAGERTMVLAPTHDARWLEHRMTDRRIAPSTLDSESVDIFARTAQRSTSRPHRESQERVRRLQPSPSQIAQAWSGRFRVPLLPSANNQSGVSLRAPALLIGPAQQEGRRESSYLLERRSIEEHTQMNVSFGSSMACGTSSSGRVRSELRSWRLRTGRWS
jgi:hypothetical protein